VIGDAEKVVTGACRVGEDLTVFEAAQVTVPVNSYGARLVGPIRCWLDNRQVMCPVGSLVAVSGEERDLRTADVSYRVFQFVHDVLEPFGDLGFDLSETDDARQRQSRSEQVIDHTIV